MDKADQALNSAFRRGRLLKFSNRELILRGAESPQGVMYLDSGFVKVYSITEHGTENLHIIYKPGEVFPLIWAFKDIDRGVYYESLGPTKIYVLPKAEFLELTHSSTEFNRELLETTIGLFHVFADRLDNLEYNDARDRVVYRLLFLAGRFGKQQADGILIAAPITHQHIADSINLARETVSREIEKLEQEKLVGHHKRHLILKDLERLEAITGEPTSLNLWGLR